MHVVSSFNVDNFNTNHVPLLAHSDFPCCGTELRNDENCSTIRNSKMHILNDHFQVYLRKNKNKKYHLHERQSDAFHETSQ